MQRNQGSGFVSGILEKMNNRHLNNGKRTILLLETLWLDIVIIMDWVSKPISTKLFNITNFQPKREIVGDRIMLVCVTTVV